MRQVTKSRRGAWMHRALFLFCGATWLSVGCYAPTQVVLGPDLGPLVTADQPAPIFLRTATGRGVRLDPNSQICVLRAGRGYLPCQEVGALEVGARGLRIDYPLTIHDLHEVRVTGLDPVSTEALREIFGPKMIPSPDAQAWSLQLSESSNFVTLLRQFIDLAGKRHSLDAYETYRRRWPNQAESSPLDEDAFARFWVHQQGPEAGLGRWTFATKWEQVAKLDGSEFVVLPMEKRGSEQAESSYDVQLPGKFWVRSGIPWEQIQQIEISNLSGARTLGALAGYAALSLALLPLAGLASLGGRGSGSGGTVIRVASDVVTGQLASMSAAETSGAAVGPGPSPELEAAALTRPLFGARLRRQSIVRFVLASELDVGTDFTRLEGMQTGALAALRFKDVFEIGAGGRYLLSVLPGGPGPRLVHGGVGTFHLGLHLDLDARRRFAIPLLADLGAGGALKFHGRFQLGLRVRVAGPFYMGVYPLNPVVGLYHDEQTEDTAASPQATFPRPPTWTFRSTIESGVAF